MDQVKTIAEQRIYLDEANELYTLLTGRWIQVIIIGTNDHTIGWQNLNPLSHPNATLAPQVRQARASGENLNYLLSR